MGMDKEEAKGDLDMAEDTEVVAAAAAAVSEVDTDITPRSITRESGAEMSKRQERWNVHI